MPTMRGVSRPAQTHGRWALLFVWRRLAWDVGDDEVIREISLDRRSGSPGVLNNALRDAVAKHYRGTVHP